MHKQRSNQDRATLLNRIAYGIFLAVSVGLVAGLLWGFWMVFFHAPPEYFSTFVVVAASISGVLGFFLHINIVAEILAGVLEALMWFFGDHKK
ncbi:MAG: hypothetical protein KME63_13400 [Candidatus Thiodiazotropha sp. (ex Clathrolucina costata)]|nr:hypothetical protein [Candidatus Thiodiazotropha taylori]